MSGVSCSHCLLPFPERDAVYANGDDKKVFCCHGCLTVYDIINSEGLSDFYEKRDWDSNTIKFDFKKDIDIKSFVQYVIDKGDKKEINIFIEGIHCSSCVWLNEKILTRTDGIEYAMVNYASHRAKIIWDPNIIGLKAILDRIMSIGYVPKVYSESEKIKLQKAENRTLLIRLGTAIFLSMQLMLYSVALYAGFFHGIDYSYKLTFELIALVITTPILFYSGMPFMRSTVRAFRRLRFNMDSLIVIGSGSAYLYSIYQITVGGKVYFDTSAMIITLILVGRYLESLAKESASKTIEKLINLSPKEARLISGDKRDMVLLTFLKVGDVVEVLPGEKVPTDGVIVSGESEVNESIITGESKPIQKVIGDKVIGGTINMYGVIRFEVSSVLENTVLFGIIRAVEDAQARKPKIQSIADRIVGVFVPFILILSLSTIITYIVLGTTIHEALLTGISILVIACPCSLGLATPLAVLVFTNSASSRGILIKGGEVIENVSRLSHIVFDKTGTITLGKPKLKEIILYDDNINQDYLLSITASIERLSEHSIAHAINDSAFDVDLFDVDSFKALPGSGVRGIVKGKEVFIGNRELMDGIGINSSYLDRDDIIHNFESCGNTVIFTAWANVVRGAFIISDVIRDEAKAVIDDLKLRFNLSIVSGDNRLTTTAIANEVGIKSIISEASPIKKREFIHNLQADKHRVMMVGDGINDAPGLTESAVGIAMGRGTDIAMDSADAVLIRDSLSVIPYFN